VRFDFWRKVPEARVAQKLYLKIVQQSRRQEFYLQGGVADTIDGRFDLLVLNVYLVMRRLKDIGPGAGKLSQALFDEMFSNLDGDLREMGIGDLSIGKKVQKMAEAFYGRVEGYEAGLKHKDPAVLKEALMRNLYRATPVAGTSVDLMYDYMSRQSQSLAEQAPADILTGEVAFAALAASEEASVSPAVPPVE